MDFQTAVKTCFSKYVTFEGRAARSEYWWFTLFNVAGQLLLGVVDMAVLGMTEITPLSSLFALALFLPGISVTVRRLHDKDRSGWWFWIALVPIIGWLLMLYWMVTPGTAGANRFGPDPLDGAGGDWAQPDEDYAPSSIPRVDN